MLYPHCLPIKGKIGLARSDIPEGVDASLTIRRGPWNQWEASQDYTATTLPVVIGTIGGLWSAFSGVLVGIFGTSVAFVFFGKELRKFRPTV